MKLDWVSGREQGKIGLQLYTVRDLLKSEFKRTLSRKPSPISASAASNEIGCTSVARARSMLFTPVCRAR